MIMPLQRTPPDPPNPLNLGNTRVTRQQSNKNNVNKAAVNSTQENCNTVNELSTTINDIRAPNQPTAIISDTNQLENNAKRPRRNSSAEDYDKSGKIFFGPNHQLELICGNLVERVEQPFSILKDNERSMLRVNDCLKELASDNLKIREELGNLFEVNSNVLSLLKSSPTQVSIPSSDLGSNGTNTVQPTTSNGVLSFAQVVSDSEHIVVIKPNDETQDNASTFTDIKKQISPSNKEIKKVRKAKNGGMIIQCGSQEAKEALKNDATTKLGDKYKITAPEKKNPKLRIFGMSERLSGDEIKMKLNAQNPDISNESSIIDIPVVFGSNNSNRFGFKMMTDPKTFQAIMVSQKLRIGWDLCSVSESLDIIRCYNCSSYNHVARDCKSVITCPKCSGDHSLSDCQSELEKCTNCQDHNKRLNLNLDTSHSAMSLECPVYRRLADRQRNRINYVQSLENK